MLIERLENNASTEMACTINRLFVQKRIDVVLIAPLSNDLSNLRVVATDTSLLQTKQGPING